jgi:hypothetical protein
MSPGGFGRGDPRFEVVAPQRLAGAFVTPREPAARRTTISQSFGSMRRNTIRESKLQRVGWRNSLRNRGTGATPGWGTSPTPLPGLTRHTKPDPILYALRVNNMSLARTTFAIWLPAQTAFPSDPGSGACEEEVSATTDGGNPDAALHAGFGPLGECPKPWVDPTC